MGLLLAMTVLYMTKEEIEKEFFEKFPEIIDEFKELDLINFFEDESTCSAQILNFISKIRRQDIDEEIEFIKKIDVSGGGSGRRIKEQLLGFLEDKKKHV